MARIGSRLVAAMLVAMGVAVAAEPAQALDQHNVCAAETRRLEGQHGIPDGLLTAISHVESGRYDKTVRALIAWPWTVMAEGKGRYLPSKAAAIAEVMALQARGVKNIDVGCMQVNLQVHGRHFRDLNAALDPRTNVAYAARFLSELYAETGSWALAGTHYHSRTPHLAARYRLKLAKAWSRLQDDGGPDLPRGVVAAAALPGQIGGAGAERAKPPVYRPLPVSVQQAAARYAEQAAQRKQELAAERDQARRAADAWRQQKLAEYHTRKVQLQEQRANKGGIPARP